jgi:hypothetical protein
MRKSQQPNSQNLPAVLSMSQEKYFQQSGKTFQRLNL